MIKKKLNFYILRVMIYFFSYFTDDIAAYVLLNLSYRIFTVHILEYITYVNYMHYNKRRELCRIHTRHREQLAKIQIKE